MIVSQLLTSRRLQILLTAQGVSISYFMSVRVTLVGLFSSNFLPSTMGGDVVKMVILAQQRHDTAVSVASVFADRIANLLATVLLLPSLASLGSLLDPRTARRIGEVGIVSVAVGLVLAGGIYVSRHAVHRWLWAEQSGSLISKFKGVVVRLIEIAVTWGQQPRVFVWSLLLSLGSVLSSVLGLWLVARSLDMKVSYLEMLAIAVLVYFITLIPISLNGLGTQEVSLVFLLTGLGTTETQALALAIVARLLYILPSLLGAFGVPGPNKQQSSEQDKQPTAHDST